MIRRLAAAAAIIVSQAAYAEVSFKGYVLGSERADLHHIDSFTCSPSTSAVADEICARVGDTVAGVMAKGVSLLLLNGRLEAIYITFPQESFDRVQGALVEKYGPPKSQAPTSVQNRMGATFSGTVSSWEVEGTTILAKPFSGKITDGAVTFETATYLSTYALRKSQRNSNDAQDF